MSKPLEPGDPAPDFTAEAIGGPYHEPTPVRLTDLRGERVVLYFYPKDDTPGCTTQACGLRDTWNEIQKTGAKIFGVSIDSIDSHRKFQNKHNLPFPLLSDPDHRIVESYGLWGEKTLYGKKFMGTERSTFVIGPDGRIEAVFRKVNPEKHASLLLESLSRAS